MEANRWHFLADASDVQRWAEDRYEVRSEFPRWIRRLIRQTNDQVIRLDMRAGKEVDVHGYDGVVEAGRGTPFVHEGLSVWELGTGADPGRKASDDYRDRTEDSLGIDKSEAVFVAVAARRWADKDQWAKTRREQEIWRDVIAFDVSNIEEALEAAPAVHFAFSEMVGKPVSGVRTIEDWWERFSMGTQPALTPEMVLAGRADQAASLLRVVAQEGRITTIAAPSTDDVIAFVAGTLLTTLETDRDDLLARTLIVHDAPSLRMLEHSTSLLILVPFDEELRRAAELVRTHHIILLAPEGTPSDFELPALDRETFASLLEGAGVEEQEARRLANAAHRSIGAFRRDRSTRARAQRRWTIQSLVERRAWLANSWNERRSGDREALSELFGTGYEQAREELKDLAGGEDPVFTIVGGTWALVSPEEAWDFGVAAVDDFDLSSLEKTVQSVLGAIDPGLELPAEERWKAKIYGKTPIHSSDLRSGLATTLALCGARGHETTLGGAGRLSDWAGRVVYQLFDRANDDVSAQVWASLSDVLPLLAEATPDVFLSAVQTGASGSEPVLRLMFMDSTAGDFSISSPHTGLLWALERVAWSPDHASLASDLLARLAVIDPGGRLSNRPLASLADIFRLWLPQTSLPMERRLAVLSALQRNHEPVAWALLLQLLPESSNIGNYTDAPRFRDWKPDTEGVSNQEYWDSTSLVAQRLLDMAEHQPDRWPELLERLADFPPPERASTLDKLTAMADDEQAAGEDVPRQAIWATLDELVRRHRAFADAEWALPASEIDQLARIADRMTPIDPIEAHRWLFDTHWPEMRTERDTFAERQRQVEAARAEAIKAVLESGGIEAVELLARSVGQPGFVGTATADHGTEELDQRVVLLLDNDDAKLASFAYGYCVRRAERGHWPWISAQLKLLTDRSQAEARLLQVTDDLVEAWRIAKELGPDVDAAYWADFSVIGRGPDFPLVNDATRALLDHNRLIAAIDLMSLYSREDGSPVSPELMLEALERLVEAPPEPEAQSRLDSYHLNQLLNQLRASEIDEDRLALLEWRLLPALGFQAHSPVLDRHLSRDPEFFVEILSLIFRPHSLDTDDGEPVPEHIAGNAWRLLHEWKVVPGSADRGAEVDEEQLMNWIISARELLAKADRVAVGDVYIGHVLAHARGDEDGTWPTRPIRNVIERLANLEIEEGFRTQTYNNRGTTTRGPLSGGGLERGEAKRYRELAARIRDEWPRTGAILAALADGYEREAQLHDEEAERLRQGLDR
jgi:hypothetical protein